MIDFRPGNGENPGLFGFWKNKKGDNLTTIALEQDAIRSLTKDFLGLSILVQGEQSDHFCR